ncbi:uncharacterized protein LOC103722451 [Phoenix dactylifera]|uniref:Uncharacterized protein LOC103722451 n=1 Tax=Phoenix dactylifera TaxID=42345 RepID=A0A8B8ZN09_PHODC|nr:uncharacterized protein LOC103722451 [Phoenix dactylifera]XP_026666342.1 uncharacterized protein LOC103722451 [Phoenix dactylifera]XP_026666343.1 uncharacterized protein LOC103722451 [Phoenix dactylifera]XP_026666344.1 uncharacterized protein LOC103722451 [Phoenix dactylifera]XP_038972964.1 uncharacterized protein LOC103722451 [Phoenix dactylifera]XP_038972965.1 uncharacterized protein LOC103722451 [Phoenix dactylifera]
MAMPWGSAIYLMKMVWMILKGWISSCLMVANEIARALRTGDIGPLPVG